MEDMDSSSSNSSHVPSANEAESDTGLAMRRLPNLMTVLRCNENEMRGGPHLIILEEPQASFRFRYKSEMGGTHGCLLGRSSKSKNKTHPSVELIGYKGRARIKCHLVQFDRNEEHPHKLGVIDEDNPEPLEISQIVGPTDFALGFPNMGIIYTGKKQVPNVLYNRYMRAQMDHLTVDAKQLHKFCENQARDINLNKVRLKFSAHDVNTDRELCPPVFSDTINNLKSAETNELRICRIDRNTGSVKGNEEIYILVEKVNKKNIKVRFVEVADGDDEGEPVWSDEASFTQNDVHHQFAIVFKTPPYRNLEVTKDVPVYIELYRPKDGRRSERTPFTYKASPRFLQSKKRKANPSVSSLSSLDGSSGGSLHSTDMPVILNTMNNFNAFNQRIITGISVPEPLPVAPRASTTNDQTYMQTLVPPPSGTVGLAEALYLRDHRTVPTMAPPLHPGVPAGPSATYSGTYAYVSSDFNLNDINVADLLREGGLQNSGEFRQVVENLESDPFRDYLQHMTSKLKEEDYESTTSHLDINFRMNRSALRNDAAVKKENDGKMRGGWTMEDQVPRLQAQSSHYVVKKEPYTATYSPKDGVQVQRDENQPLADSDIFDKHVSQEIDCLVGLFLNLIKNKDLHSPGYLKIKIAETLEKLMEHRMSNGDSFAHMLVMSHKLPMLEYIVKQLHDTGLLSHLNSQNERGESILHLAIKEDLNKHIKLLVEKGCDPMLEDVEGNTALHLAVLHSDKDQECLKQLLDAMRQYNYLDNNMDKLNNGKETPLHLSAKYGHAESLKLLLDAGANVRRKSASGKLPLHYAVSGDHFNTLQHLIPHTTKENVDELDGNNNTALQIVCSGTQRRHSLAIAELLCKNGANVLKSSGGNSCPLKLASEDPQMLSLLRKYLPEDTVEVKSEPEDEFESAEEESSDEESWEEFAPQKADKTPGGTGPEQVRQEDGSAEKLNLA